MEAITTALTTGFGTVQSGILGVVVAVIPIGLVILAAKLGVTYGKKFFGAISK